MKWLSIFIIAVVVLGGGWYLLNQNTGSSEGTENTEESMMEEGGEMMGGSNTSGTGGSMMEDGTGMVDNPDVTVELTGKNFAFSKNEIRVKKGQTVKVVFTSEGGFHDWKVDEFNAATAQVNTDGTSSVTFVADKAGEFEYYCSVGSHRQMGMVGKLIVE